MKKTKKFISAFITLSLFISSTVFADIPSGTVVIGNKAYNINYANDKKNIEEIRYQVFNRESDIYVKGFNGKWYDNDSGKEVPKYMIPSLTYKDLEGNLYDYAEEDGEKIILNVAEASFLSSNQIKIKFNKKVLTESALNKDNYKIGNKVLREVDNISLEENGQVVIINLNDNLSEENIQSNIYVSENILDSTSNKMDTNYERNILVLNDLKASVDKNVSGDINIIMPNYSLSNIKVEGNIYANADNVTIKDSEVTEKIILNPGKDGNSDLINVKSHKVVVLSGGKHSIKLSNIRADILNVNSSSGVRVVSKNRSEIGSTNIENNTILESMTGSFGEITVDIKEKIDKREVVLNGIFKKPITLKRGVKLTASKNSVISLVKVDPYNADNDIALEGKFEEVELEKTSKLNLFKNTEVKKLTANADITLSGDETVKIYKVFADEEVNVDIDKSSENKGFIIPKVNSEEITDTPSVPPSIPISPPSNIEYKPIASNVLISGKLNVGEILSGSYQYTDEDGDKEGSSEYKWYRADNVNGINKIEIKDANESTYKLSSDDEGKYIAFEVTPIAITGSKNGVSVISKFIGPITVQEEIEDSIVDINIDGNNVTITLESENLYEEVSVRIVNKQNGRECYCDQNKSVGNKVRFDTKLLDTGDYDVIINAYGPEKELIKTSISIGN